MCKLVDKYNFRMTGNNAVEVHLLKTLAFVFNTPPRDDFETLQKRFGFSTAVGLYDAADDVVAVLLPGAGLQQHLVGLANAGRSADEDAKLPDTPLLASGCFEQGLWRRPLVVIASLICHR